MLVNGIQGFYLISVGLAERGANVVLPFDQPSPLLKSGKKASGLASSPSISETSP
jgi:hypothetical protein